MFGCCLMATWRPVNVGAVRCVALRLLLGVVLLGSLATTTLANEGSVHGAEVTGAFSRSLVQSLDCSTADRCGSSCKPCDPVTNGQPTCVRTLNGYSCGVRCNKGFVQKVAEGVLYCGHGTGLKFHDHFIKTARNATRRNYMRWGDIRRKLQNLGATTATKVAEVACNSTDVPFSCLDALLMAVLPAAYSSNSSADTGGYAYISPAQDQGDCAACTGFALTAAAEAAVNVYKQQSWPLVSVSEQYISFCRMTDPIDCNSGGSYVGLKGNVRRLGRLASRACYPYAAAALGNCVVGDTCAAENTDLPAGSAWPMMAVHWTRLPK